MGNINNFMYYNGKLSTGVEMQPISDTLYLPNYLSKLVDQNQISFTNVVNHSEIPIVESPNAHLFNNIQSNPTELNSSPVTLNTDSTLIANLSANQSVATRTYATIFNEETKTFENILMTDSTTNYVNPIVLAAVNNDINNNLKADAYIGDTPEIANEKRNLNKLPGERDLQPHEPDFLRKHTIVRSLTSNTTLSNIGVLPGSAINKQDVIEITGNVDFHLG